MSIPVRDLAAMVAVMAPVRVEGEFAFVTGRDELASKAISSVREAEGLSLVVPAELAPDEPRHAMITLTVHSSLEGVGLTAAVASRLARHGISCNMVAGYHHDHLFVPLSEADRALALLQALQAEGTA